MAKIISPRNFYKTLHRIADQNLGAMELAFLRNINLAADSVDADQLYVGLHLQDATRVFAAVDAGGALTDKLRASITQVLRRTFNKAALATETLAPVSLELRFDISAPGTLRWVRMQGATLVRRIGSDTRTNIRRVMARGLRAGETTQTIADDISRIVGLRPDQLDTLDRLEAKLTADGANDAAITRALDARSMELLRDRSLMIARTETIRAVSAGQQELWKQAVDDGLIDPDTARRIWIPADDEAVCPICSEIPNMNPDGVGLDEEFDSPVGPVMFPGDPHPNCRCSVALEFGESAGTMSAAQEAQAA